MKKWFYPVSLILLFIILVTAVIPAGCVYGSNTDWLSQHVTLAETIRNACLEQHTLLPSWIGLGGGSNGYQFAYYGFLRPDILIGCLLPQIPMMDIIIGYMMAVYLGSVLLVYIWLRTEQISPLRAWLGSMLFMTAGCLFHMHRQIMFVNYLPFLLLAFLCIRKQRYKWLPLCLLLICLSSFYFSISAFAAAMSAALLLPTALVLLEHSRLDADEGPLKLLELFEPNPVFNNILFNEYGMGLTLICFYAILAGLKIKNFRQDSILFLLFGMFGVRNLLLYTERHAVHPPKDPHTVYATCHPALCTLCRNVQKDRSPCTCTGTRLPVPETSPDIRSAGPPALALCRYASGKPALVQSGTVPLDPAGSGDPLLSVPCYEAETEICPSFIRCCIGVADSSSAAHISGRHVSDDSRHRGLGERI